jgi:hypothetical protein
MAAAPEFGLQPQATRGYDPASQSIDPKALVVGQRYRIQLRFEYVEPERTDLRNMYRDFHPGTPQGVINASVASIGQPYEGTFEELIGADRTVPFFTDIAAPGRLRGGRLAFPPQKYFFFRPGHLNANQIYTEALGREKLPPELAGKIGEFAGATDPYRVYRHGTTGTGTGVSVPRGGRARRTRRVSRTHRVRKTRRRHR